jgi:signal peptidase I
MEFRKILVANLLVIILLLSLVGNILFLECRVKAVDAYLDNDYVPIKWALIVLGGFEYYKHPPGFNAIQKVEHWIGSEGVPYDIIEDDNIEAPTNTPTSSKYPLQYANGTIRYGVFVIIMNHYLDTSAVNINHIYSAVSNGTNAIIFGMAAKCVPELLNITANDVSYFIDYFITTINYTVLKGFSDGIEEFPAGNYNIEFPNYYGMHANVSNTEGKTLWYTCKANSKGEFWNGMMNITYGSGKVFWHSNIPSTKYFLWYSTFSSYWNAFKIISHSINFMFKQVKRVDLGLQGYKRWGGAITYRLDQDTYMGIEKPPEEALRAGWYVDVVICALGYLTTGGSLTDGMPDGYTGAPSTKVKHGTWTNLVVSTEPLKYASRTFIVYNNTVDGNYNRVKVDWNQNNDFSDDTPFEIWENMTSIVTGLKGTYYWSYIDNWTNPTLARLGWWCPLRDRISDFSWWKAQGQHGYIRYGFHGWQHQTNGDDTIASGYVTWNGTQFLLNQTWIEQKFTEARNELAYCLGSAGNGFEANKVLVSHPGNEYKREVDAALFNLDWVYLTYGDGQKNEPGWFLYNDRETAMTCGAGAAMMD